MPRQWLYVREPTEEEIINSPGGPGKKRLAFTILELLKQSAKKLEESEITVEPYQKISIKKTLEFLRRLGAVSSEGSNRQSSSNAQSLIAYPCVKTWLDSLKAGPDGKESQGQKSSRYTLARYMDFLQSHSQFKDPEALIEDALDANRRKLKLYIQLMKDFVRSLQDVDNLTRQKIYQTLRSFYLHNDAALPSSPLKLATANNHLVKKDGKDTKVFGLVRKILPHAEPRDRAIILCMMQGALDDSTLSECFNFMVYSQLCEKLGQDWRKWNPKDSPVQIWLYRPKTNTQYYTFLDVDAIQALKDWLAVRFNLAGREIQIEQDGRDDHIARSEPIFITYKGKKAIPAALISKIFRHLGFVSGVNVRIAVKRERFRGARNRYMLHAHEVRDSLKTLAHPLGLSNEAEYFLGHSIDKLKYDKSPESDFAYWREIYSRFSPYLNVVSNDPEKAELTVKLEQTAKEKEKAENELYTTARRLQEELSKVNQEKTDLVDLVRSMDKRLATLEGKEKLA